MYNQNMNIELFEEFKPIIHKILSDIGHPYNGKSTLMAITIASLINIDPLEGLIIGKRHLRDGARTTDILNKFARELLNLNFAENTRETLRKNYIKKLTAIGIVEVNKDEPGRSTNSGKTNYTINPDFEDLIFSYGTHEYDSKKNRFMNEENVRKQERYNTLRRMRIHVRMPNGDDKYFSPGEHNLIQKEIVEKIIPKLNPLTPFDVIYIGDTANKEKHINETLTSEISLQLSATDKIPDVIAICNNKLLVFEAVASDGPIDNARFNEINTLLNRTTINEIEYYTVFLSSKKYRQFSHVIAPDTHAIDLERDIISEYKTL